MEYIRGWMGYYCYCQTPSILTGLESWIRRRLRCFIWKKWKTFRKRADELMKRGVWREAAYGSAWADGMWVASKRESLQVALPNSYFTSIGVLSLTTFVRV